MKSWSFHCSTKPGSSAAKGDEFAPSLGKVPILWDGDTVIWDSLAIIEYCADKVGRERFWPEDEAARGMARSMAAEMHSGFAPCAANLPMNVRRNFGSVELSREVEADIDRILNLWAQARARFGGTCEYLFCNWSAVDIMFAPVVTRFVTYGVRVPPFAALHGGGASPRRRRRMDRACPGRALGDRGGEARPA